MNYNFFLFVKLNDVIFPSKVEYDLQFEYLQVKFREWEEWDLINVNADKVGAYESMLNFIQK